MGKYKFSLKPEIKNYIEFELAHYRENKKELENYKNSLIPSNTPNYDSVAVCGGQTSNPTENAAIKLASSPYILATEKTISAIDRVLARLDDADKQLINLVYWKQSHTAEGAGMIIGYSRRTVYRHIDRILTAIALELGIINL